MCGRCITLEYDQVESIIRAIETDTPFNAIPDWPARFPKIDTFPGSAAEVIVPTGSLGALDGESSGLNLSARNLIWGFTADWNAGSLLFNTRIESASKPTWRQSFQQRRCLIPVMSFFESSDTERIESPRTHRMIKKLYEFSMPTDEPTPFLIGGIYDEGCFSMVTTEPNNSVSPVHHRMPLIISQDEIPAWFGSDYLDLADRSDIALKAYCD